MSLLDKEPVKRAEKVLKDFDKDLNIIVLNDTARTAKDAASSLKCEIGAIVKSLVFRAEDCFILTFLHFQSSIKYFQLNFHTKSL